MTEEQPTNQPNLFDLSAENVEIEKVLLRALANFRRAGKF
jgi:hypothetical protein